MLNELASMGITPNSFKDVRESITKNIEEETKEIRSLKIMKAQYRELKRIEFMARMAKEDKILPIVMETDKKHDNEKNKSLGAPNMETIDRQIKEKGANKRLQRKKEVKNHAQNRSNL